MTDNYFNPEESQTRPASEYAPIQSLERRFESANSRTEEIHVSGNQLVDKVKEILHQGNIRRVSIKREDKVMLDLPLTFVAVGVVIAPGLAIVGALAALVTECTISVERND